MTHGVCFCQHDDDRLTHLVEVAGQVADSVDPIPLYHLAGRHWSFVRCVRQFRGRSGVHAVHDDFGDVGFGVDYCREHSRLTSDHGSHVDHGLSGSTPMPSGPIWGRVGRTAGS